MTKKINHHFAVGCTEDGKWLAVSSCAPYFCFEGESSDEVEATANRALEFYFGLAGHLTKRKPIGGRQKTLSTFSRKKTVLKECVDA